MQRVLAGNRTLALGLAILAVVGLILAVGPSLSPYSPTRMRYREALRPPSLSSGRLPAQAPTAAPPRRRSEALLQPQNLRVVLLPRSAALHSLPATA